MWKNLGIRQRLIIAFSALLLIIAMISTAGIVSVYSLADEITRLASTELANGAQIGRAQWGIWELRFGIANYIAMPDAQARAKIKQDGEKWIRIVQENMQAYMQSKHNPAQMRLLAEWSDAFKNYLEARPHWFDLIDQGKMEEAADWRAKKTNFYGAANVKAFQGLLDEQDSAARRESLMKDLQIRNGLTVGTMVGLAALGIVVGLLLGVLLAIRLGRVLARVVTELESASTSTRAASEQVSNSSQALAQGANQQAASLEETSATLEEISQTTRQNTEHAQKAENLAQNAQTGARKGAEAMARMIERIGAIKESAGKTAGIVKTIDEIAFQTNLLALNAAVEAARAGDAGRGFAVVAEEVRNLAQRSAEAAKQTSALIEESQQRAAQGVQASEAVGAQFGEIVSAVESLNSLIREVAVASRQQSDGVNQINGAVTQMDSVTQSNAANAEENAAASEEMSAQSQTLRAAVLELARLVLGIAGAETVGALHAGPAAIRGGTRSGAGSPSLKGGSLRERIGKEHQMTASRIEPDVKFRDF